MRRPKPPHRIFLLLAEGLAVGALVHSGVGLVGTHQDLVQSAVVLALAVVGALMDGAFDALIGIAVHSHFLLLFWFGSSMALTKKNSHGNDFLFVAFGRAVWYDEK